MYICTCCIVILWRIYKVDLHDTAEILMIEKFCNMFGIFTAVWCIDDIIVVWAKCMTCDCSCSQKVIELQYQYGKWSELYMYVLCDDVKVSYTTYNGWLYYHFSHKLTNIESGTLTLTILTSHLTINLIHLPCLQHALCGVERITYLWSAADEAGSQVVDRPINVSRNLKPVSAF